MAASMNPHDLECEVCCELFDEQSRKPKFLPCGHTLCLPCIEVLYRNAQTKGENSFLCPVDRKETNCRPEELKNNFYILSQIQESHERAKLRDGRPRFWCVDCKAVAGSACEEEHTIRRLTQERRRQMKPTVELLEKAVSTQCHLVEKLEATEASTRVFVEQQVAETRDAVVQGKKALMLLEDSLDLVGPGWDLAQAELEAARQSSAQRLTADEDSLQLLAVDGKCKVTVSVPSGVWKANVDLAADAEGTAVVRGLLVHMQRADMLRREEQVVVSAPNVRLVMDLRRYCEEQMQWLDEHPSASLDELSGRIDSSFARLSDLKDSVRVRTGSQMEGFPAAPKVSLNLQPRMQQEQEARQRAQEPLRQEAAQGTLLQTSERRVQGKCWKIRFSENGFPQPLPGQWGGGVGQVLPLFQPPIGRSKQKFKKVPQFM